MSKDKRSKFVTRCDAAKRLVMWNMLAKPLKLVLITEFPKSGGTWFSQLMSEACETPFPRNKTPPLRECVMHGHHLYRNRFGRTIAMVRDGRDIMVSAYHHFLVGVARSPNWLVKGFRDRLPLDDYDDITGNMPEFIRFMFEDYSKGMWHFNWSEFAHSVLDQPNVCIVKYEDMLETPVELLEGAIRFLGRPVPSNERLQEVIDKFSFKNQTNRQPGEESKASFLRKGISGDWKNVFTEEASDCFKTFGGKELIKLGYESDTNWQSKLSS